MLLKSFALFAFLVCAVQVSAESGTKIGIIDVQKVIDKSVAGKAAKNNIESEVSKGRAKLAQLKSDFDKEKADLEKQSSLLSGSALADKRDSLGKKERSYGRMAQDIEEDIVKKNDAQMAKIVAEIDNVIKEMAKTGEYNFIFEKERQFIVYANADLDISDKVIEELDRRKIAM